MQNLKFRNLSNKRIRKIFENVLKNYPPLTLHPIVLEKISMKKTTMRAQPRLFSFLGSKKNKKFKVQINSSTRLEDQIELDKLSDQVLFGWFAHELGHVMDYRDRGFFEMILYGLRYLLSSAYRKKVEHKADEFAIEYDMAHEILATKKYILEHSQLSENYKRRIRKYYMSMDDVHAILAQDELDELVAEDADILSP